MKAKVLLLLTSVVFLFAGFACASYEQREIASADSDFYEKFEYYEIKTEISDYRKTNETKWDITMSVDLIARQAIRAGTDIAYTLNKLSMDRYGTYEIGTGRLVVNAGLRIGGTLQRELTVNDLSTGQYELIIQATSAPTESGKIGGRTQLLFTVTESVVSKGWRDTYIPSYAPARGDRASNKGEGEVTISGFGTGIQPDLDRLVIVSDHASVIQGPYLYGNWKSYDKAHRKKTIRNAKVVVRYYTGSAWRILGETHTNDNGNWLMKYPEGLKTAWWQVIVYTQSSFANVKNVNDGNHTWHASALFSNRSPGENQKMDATLTDHTAVNDAFKIYDDIVSVRNLFLHAGKSPKSANNVFYDSVMDGYGRHNSGSVYIYKNAPDYNVTMHEITHLYMYNLYQEMPDHPNCSQHNIYKVSSQGCAWVEGWAIFIPALFTNGIFEFPNGVVVDLETTTIFERGDMVEGRVAGALWDVYDDVPDALDHFTAPLADIYKAMWSGGTKHTFLEWWEEWKSLGYNVEEAKWSLKENSIDYEPQ